MLLTDRRCSIIQLDLLWSVSELLSLFLLGLSDIECRHSSVGRLGVSEILKFCLKEFPMYTSIIAL